jgi:hypothetical protein
MPIFPKKSGPLLHFAIADTDRIAFFYYSFAEIEAILSLIQPKAEIAKQPLRSSAFG